MRGLRILIIFILLLSLFIVLVGLKKERDKKYVISEVDGDKYLVRDLEDKQRAANQLSRIKMNIMRMTEHLYNNRDTKYKEYKQYIEQLKTRINDVVIKESSENSVHTSYSVNKGEQLVFCLRSRAEKDRLHSLNLLMYVTLHEMAHVACPEYGHTPLFKKIFAFFAKVAVEEGFYNKIEFNVEPEEYCGLTISESII